MRKHLPASSPTLLEGDAGRLGRHLRMHKADTGDLLIEIGAWATRFLDDPAGAEARWSLSFRAWSEVVPLTHRLDAAVPHT